MKPLHLIITLPLATAFIPGGITSRTHSSLRQNQVRSRTSNTIEGFTGSTPATNSTLYNSLDIPQGASTRSISDAELAIQTKIRGRFSVTELIEINGDRDADRASLGLAGVFIGGVSSAIIADATLPGPEIIRFIVVWILSFSPLAFVGAGLAVPEDLQRLLSEIQRLVFRSYRGRVIQHEAGHFLLGYLLGFPVKGYSVGGMKSAVEFEMLRDDEAGPNRARLLGFDRPRKNDDDDNGSARASTFDDEETTPGQFFDKGGRGESALSRSVFRDASSKKEKYDAYLRLPAESNPKKAWPYRGFSPATLDKLTVISLAGVAAEILGYGNSEGGYADLEQLRKLFAASEVEVEERDGENRVRFAVGYAVSQLRLRMGVLDDLVAVMERGGSVEECVLAIENCENVRGSENEIERRERLRGQMSLVEKVFLGGKNADAEKSVIEGKGGGESQGIGFKMEGDDPFYAAGAVAVIFLLWASAGGLSLH